VSPTIADGAAGPSNPLSETPAGAITADISGTTATVTYAGLAPGFAGLYQANVTIPSGLTAGDNYMDLAGPDSYTSEALISIAGTTAGASELPVHVKPMGKLKHTLPTSPRIR
jgi:adhesin/invasin